MTDFDRRLKKTNAVFGVGTVLPQDPAPGRSPGRTRARLHAAFLIGAKDEREPPSRADMPRRLWARSHPIPPAPLRARWLRQRPRRIQYACPLLRRCG